MDNQDYLTDYRLFFDNFYKSFELDNPLPVHIGKYNVAEFEILGEVICWCLEYLNARDCPSSLIAPLCRSVISELEEVIRKDPESCGYRPKEDDYQTLRLMQATIKKLNDVCLRYRDNSEVSRLPPPPPVSPSVSAAAVKNSRRTMEDCHIVIHDLHALFGIEGYGVASYYAVFDGHIGSDAALYSCSHIYQYLVESQYYPTNPEAAFKEAFIKTDERFIDKSNKENLKSGTTAVCILIRHDLGKMYVAWLGDSQAILVNGRDYIQLVNPHRPEQLEEKERIEALGGSVVYWGTWRVNGQLAVSRAIGDVDYKPYVTAEPDVTSYDLSGDEDFLLLACDGLWDVVSEKHAVEEVYKCLEQNKGDRSRVSQSLVQAAKSLGSKDNISVVVAWLDMSSLENGHFVPEMDAADDLLPPILRSLKPTVQPIAPPGEDSGDVGGEGDSGDDSDEEWNYISGKENRQPNQHAKRELTQEEMESQLNPNAAEFVPVFGGRSPISDIDITDISHSPSKRSEIKNLDNVVIPSQNEFYNEISKRPSELEDFGEHDSTVNGGDLTDLSTKAVFGDDSVCLASTVDSSLIQNESLKSTNPFASSQVPNFVQDHFSAPAEDSKITAEFDFMSSNEKPEVLSPSAPVQEAYSSGQTDLSGITFGDGLNVDDLVRSKQDSPLLRESPEPNLLNGRHDHESNEATPELESNVLPNEQNDKAESNVKEIVEVEVVGKTPEDFINEVCKYTAEQHKAPEVTPDVLFHSDHGPETSVDSESDDDVLVSPKIKEREFAANSSLLTEVVASEDPVCSLKPNHDHESANHGHESANHDHESAEKTPESGIELEEEHVFHKDEEDEVISYLEPTDSFTKVSSENPFETSNKPESVFSDDAKSEGEPSDFEIVNTNEGNVENEENNDRNEEGKTTIDLAPQPVEEVITKEEVHEDLICPIKETPLLNEKLANASETENDLFDSKENCGSVYEFSNEHHLENGLESEKLIKEPVFSLEQEHQLEKNYDEVLAPPTEADDDIVCPLKKVDDVFEKKHMFSNMDDNSLSFDKNSTGESNLEEVDKVFKQNDDIICQVEREELVCPIKKDDFSLEGNYDFVCPIKKENDLSSFVENIEDSSKILQNGEETFNLLEEEKSSILVNENDNVEACPIKKVEELRLSSEDNCTDEHVKEDTISTSEKDILSSPEVEDVCNKQDEVCSFQQVETLTSEKTIPLVPEATGEMFFAHTEENIQVDNSAEAISEPSFELQQSTGVDSDTCPVKSDAGLASTEDSVLTPEKTTESLLDNMEQSSEEKIHQEESIDEMSSSMIDHGEDKGLPEPQSNQLDIVQDLQFDVNEKIEEKTDADTESDSGFEIINASEASTIEIEMKIQSEKEAGAVDEKLHLDRNEAEICEKVESEVVSRLDTVVENEVCDKPVLDIEKATEAVLNGSITPPATPPATPAPGLQVENKEGLIAAAVAAAGVATAVAAGTAAVAVVESKEEKKTDASPKKAEPVSKAAPAKTTATKPGTKPLAPSKAPAPKAPVSSSKAPAKPPSPASKTTTTASKSTGASKPTPVAAKAAPKAPSKPSTPTSAKPAGSLTSAATKSKPATSAPTKPASSAAAKPPATKPSATAAKPPTTAAKPSTGATKPSPATTAAKKLTAAPASKPPTSVSKTTVSSTTARPASKSTPSTAAKPAVSSTLKSPSGPKPPSKPSTPTGPKAAVPLARPPSVKSSVPSKPTPSSTTAKAPAKPAATKAPATKPPATTTAAKTATAAKPTPGKTGAPTKTAPAPINKKPAAPTAIKKPAAPTDKSVKEANNKLASAKTAVKKVEDKKIINKKEDIIEIEPLTQEPTVTTTNGHISLIENGIPSPEIVAEAN